MKTIYLVRHGESEANVKSTPAFVDFSAKLTEKGREQGEFIARRAATLPIQALIHSGYVRAMETADLVASKIGLKTETCELFGERKGPSELIGRPWKDPDTLKIETEWIRTFHTTNSKVRDGENFNEIVERVKKGLAYLEERKEEHILVITHGFFLRLFCAHLILGEYLTPEIFHSFDDHVRTQNTGMTVLQYNPEDKYADWSMLVWNDHAHLGEVGQGKRW